MATGTAVRGTWLSTFSGNFTRLDRDTHLFRDTYFDTTLPYWFVQRVNMPTSTLATETIQWWRNGRLWGWEGVGSCLGTCGHVYNVAQSTARLFPELERSVRLMQDPGTERPATEATGRIDFRGGKSTRGKWTENGWGYAADAQAGYVLKLYREHLLSPDNKFLDQVSPKAQKVIGYLIERDAAGNDSVNRRADLSKADGVIEDTQHTTWDSNLFGPNGYVGTWYLAALRRRRGNGPAERRHMRWQTAIAGYTRVADGSFLRTSGMGSTSSTFLPDKFGGIPGDSAD